jgi:hypothetical protein
MLELICDYNKFKKLNENKNSIFVDILRSTYYCFKKKKDHHIISWTIDFQNSQGINPKSSTIFKHFIHG